MDIFPRRKRLLAEVEKIKSEYAELRATLNTNWDLYGNTWGYTGVGVTKQTALTLSAVYSALNILSDTLSVPINVYKRLPNGDKQLVTKSDQYEYQVQYLLHTSPSQLHTVSQWLQVMEYSRNIYGNAYSYIIRTRSGLPTALKWVHPDYVEMTFDGVKIRYTIKDEKGKILVEKAPAWDVIHVKAMSIDGIIGVSPITLAAESLGFGKATQVQGNKYFEDGMTNKLAISHPGHVGEKGEKNLKESIDEKLKGAGTLVFEEGIKVYPLSITNEQSQFLGSREFSVTEVSRWFNLPKFMLANDEPTYSNIENFMSYFLTHNARPRYRIYEQEFNWKLLGNVPEYFTEFNMNALMRADLLSRYNSYAIAIQNLVMNPNEVRQLENMNSYDGGEQFKNPNITVDASNPKTE